MRTISDPVAVWDGRFQPLHRGHIGVMRAILTQFRTRLVVMIIQSSEGAVDDYSRTVNVHHRLARNPLTFWERFNLMQYALREAKLAARVSVLGIPRPDLHWETARCSYPDSRFICLTGKDDYERQKELFWARLGEQTRTIGIDDIEKISATEFKMAVKRGDEWRNYLPAGTIDYFEAIDGPNRFANAET